MQKSVLSDPVDGWGPSSWVLLVENILSSLVHALAGTWGYTECLSYSNSLNHFRCQGFMKTGQN